jgi:heat shock protein HslJ
MEPDLIRIVSARWNLLSVRTNDYDKFMFPPPNKRSLLKITNYGDMKVSHVCGSDILGKSIIEDNSIKFEDIIFPRATCSDEYETILTMSIMNALNSVNNYTFDKKGNLLMKEGTKVLIAFSPFSLFDPAPQPSPLRPPVQPPSNR